MKYYVIGNAEQRLTVNEEELMTREGQVVLNPDGSQYGCWKKVSGPWDDPVAAMKSYIDEEKIKQLHGYV